MNLGQLALLLRGQATSSTSIALQPGARPAVQGRASSPASSRTWSPVSEDRSTRVPARLRPGAQDRPSKQTAKDFTTDQEVRWCPGCGDYAILAAVQSFLPELGLATREHRVRLRHRLLVPLPVLHEHLRDALDPRPRPGDRDRPGHHPPRPVGLGRHRRRRRAVDRRQPPDPRAAPQRQPQDPAVQQPDLRPDQGPVLPHLRGRQGHQVDPDGLARPPVQPGVAGARRRGDVRRAHDRLRPQAPHRGAARARPRTRAPRSSRSTRTATSSTTARSSPLKDSDHRDDADDPPRATASRSASATASRGVVRARRRPASRSSTSPRSARTRSVHDAHNHRPGRRVRAVAAVGPASPSTEHPDRRLPRRAARRRTTARSTRRSTTASRPAAAATSRRCSPAATPGTSPEHDQQLRGAGPVARQRAARPALRHRRLRHLGLLPALLPAARAGHPPLEILVRAVRLVAGLHGHRAHRHPRLVAAAAASLARPPLAAAARRCPVLIAVNWGVYIWAVNDGHVVEASLGYFINPLVLVLLGVVVPRRAAAPAAVGRRRHRRRWPSLVLTVGLGKLPWIALVARVLVRAATARSRSSSAPTRWRASRSRRRSRRRSRWPTSSTCSSSGRSSWATSSAADEPAAHGHRRHHGDPARAVRRRGQPHPADVDGAAAVPHARSSSSSSASSSLGETMPPARWAGFAIVWIALAVFTYDGLRQGGRNRTARRTAAADALGADDVEPPV